MLRPANAADRNVVAALAMAEEAYWWGEPEATLAEAAEMIDNRGGIERGVVAVDGERVLGFASVSVDREGLIIADVSLPRPPYDQLIAWVGAQGATELEAYAGASRRKARMAAAGWQHARSVFDLHKDDVVLDKPSWAGQAAGLDVAPFRKGVDDAEVHNLVYVDAAWAEVPGHLSRSIETWQAWFGPEYRGWVVRRDGRPIGWAMGRIFADGRGWIFQLAIAKDERGAGLGRALLLHAFDALVAEGATTLGLGVQARNARALGLYESIGLVVEREWQVYEPPTA